MFVDVIAVICAELDTSPHVRDVLCRQFPYCFFNPFLLVGQRDGWYQLCIIITTARLRIVKSEPGVAYMDGVAVLVDRLNIFAGG